MAATTDLEPRTRGHRKREKTRGQLLAAGLRVLADKGEGLTVSDVVAEADVSNGTFYNYFPDRDALVDALAEHLLLTLAATAASEAIEDPALRFAVASGRVLRRAGEDATWGRVVMRLVDRPGVYGSVDRYLRDDLAEGLARGRFETGADDASIDQVTGLLVMTIRRIVEGEAGPDTALRAVERGLRALGVSPAEAGELAAAATRSPP
jgi:AcrR family transcriptional regulator